eukprot:6202935-Pleurochrysis_carterae.AAC.2
MTHEWLRQPEGAQPEKGKCRGSGLPLGPVAKTYDACAANKQTGWDGAKRVVSQGVGQPHSTPK